MSMCIVNAVTHSDKPAENYDPTLQFPSALWSVLASFCIVLVLWPTTLLLWFSLTALISLFSDTAGSCCP